jgi:hypothetical protein
MSKQVSDTVAPVEMRTVNTVWLSMNITPPNVLPGAQPTAEALRPGGRVVDVALTMCRRSVASLWRNGHQSLRITRHGAPTCPALAARGQNPRAAGLRIRRLMRRVGGAGRPTVGAAW